MFYRMFLAVTAAVLIISINCSDNSPTEPLSGTEGSPMIVFRWVTLKSAGLFLINPVSGRLYVLADGETPDWSNDGEKIAFSLTMDDLSSIMVIRPDGSGMTSLYSADAEYTELTDPLWSPDNSKIVFRISRSGYKGIAIMDSNGSNIKSIDTGYDHNNFVAWSPDGSKFALTCYDPGVGEYNIFSFNSDGTNPAALTTGSTQYSRPSWSHDGSELAYSTNGKIYKMNADGTGVVYLADGSYPVFAPDGDKIAYISGDAEDKDVYQMNKDGTEKSRVSDIDEIAFMPAWSPDGKYVAFIGARMLAGGDIVSSIIYFADIESGTVRGSMPESGRIISFSWSPPINRQ